MLIIDTCINLLSTVCFKKYLCLLTRDKYRAVARVFIAFGVINDYRTMYPFDSLIYGFIRIVWNMTSMKIQSDFACDVWPCPFIIFILQTAYIELTEIFEGQIPNQSSISPPYYNSMHTRYRIRYTCLFLCFCNNARVHNA